MSFRNSFPPNYFMPWILSVRVIPSRDSFPPKTTPSFRLKVVGVDSMFRHVIKPRKCHLTCHVIYGVITLIEKIDNITPIIFHFIIFFDLFCFSICFFFDLFFFYFSNLVFFIHIIFFIWKNKEWNLIKFKISITLKKKKH